VGIKVGLVGLGQFGSAFVSLFAGHPLVDKLVLCDTRSARVAEMLSGHGLDLGSGSLDELLGTDVDAVALFTQPWRHSRQVLACLAAGKHVYSAVPPVYRADGDGAVALDECDALVKEVERSGLVYMLGETTVYRAETVYCRERAAAGDFGEIVYGECEYWHDIDAPSCSLRDVAQTRWGESWDQHLSGGVPMHYPTHAMSSMVSIMGARVTKVTALGFACSGDDWCTGETVSGNRFVQQVAFVRMSNRATVRHMESRRIGHPGREGMRVIGTRGCFLDDVGGPKWTTVNGWERIDLGVVRTDLAAASVAHQGGHGGSHPYLVDEFVRSCYEQRTPAISVWDAVRFLAPGIVAHMSSLRDGEWLEVPDWGDPVP